MLRYQVAMLVATLLAAAPTIASDWTAEFGSEFFEKKIRPVLVTHCYKCHGEGEQGAKGGLRLDSREATLAGGDSGPAVVASDPEGSLLISALRHESFEMPPSGKLSDAVINDFELWVSHGAPDPRDGTKGERDRDTLAATHWSLQPPQLSPVPAVEAEHWPLSDVDRFVLARIEAVGAHPVADADRRTLIRRVTFDLTGLPPSPKEVEDFVNDPSPMAFQKVVDRLLDSPHFGQRWGRHWLDIVRFAESTGHERNFTYPHAWRYRDYVIDAFNTDMPYDQFLLEQVAGDLLPADDAQQLDRQRIATGLLALGPKDLLSGPQDMFRADVVDDQIDVVSRAFMGLTVSCARCHDHKFDPIATTDYYALAGIFHSTETLHGTNPGSGAGSNRRPSELYSIGADAQRLESAYRQHREKLDAMIKPVAAASSALKRARSAKDQDAELIEKLKMELDRVEAEVRELEDSAPPKPHYAMGVRDAAELVEANVLIGGDRSNKGPRVPRHVPLSLGVSPSVDVGFGEIAQGASGRLELAHWLVDRRNTLTSRVMVNRIWHHLFGQGLVSTVDNFGATGSMPSHPELLDYLALRLMDDGWSIKRTIRVLVLSRTYQLESLHDDHNFSIDPDNQWLWRMRARRLDAESLRDAVLTLSGDLECGVPPYGSIVAVMGDGCLVRQVKTDPLRAPTNHRSVYLANCRFFTPEVLDVFDGASSSLVVGSREVTTVPSQSLYLLNDAFMIDQALRTAQRLLSEDHASDDLRINRAYRLALGREPTASECEGALGYIEQMTDMFKRADVAQSRQQAWAAFCQSLFVCAEFRYLF